MRLLVRLAENPPRLNYNPIFSAVRDYLVLDVPYDQIVRGIRFGVSRTDVRDNFLGILPLIQDHFGGIRPDFYQLVQRRYYSAGKELMIPFDPPLIYGTNGQLYFPWFSFWRRNPLANDGLSLFVTIVEEVLLQDPDLEDATFQILDFSSPGRNMPRTLTVIDAEVIPRVSERTKAEMLSIFAEGFQLAKAALAGAPKRDEAMWSPDVHQRDLFDEG
jgi:hypothetical protein